MWAIIRANVLGTELFSIEVGHQNRQPEMAQDDHDTNDITGGTTLHGSDRRPVEDVRDTNGWLSTALGFTKGPSDV